MRASSRKLRVDRPRNGRERSVPAGLRIGRSRRVARQLADPRRARPLARVFHPTSRDDRAPRDTRPSPARAPEQAPETLRRGAVEDLSRRFPSCASPRTSSAASSHARDGSPRPRTRRRSPTTRERGWPKLSDKSLVERRVARSPVAPQSARPPSRMFHPTSREDRAPRDTRPSPARAPSRCPRCCVTEPSRTCRGASRAARVPAAARPLQPTYGTARRSLGRALARPERASAGGRGSKKIS